MSTKELFSQLVDCESLNRDVRSFMIKVQYFFLKHFIVFRKLTNIVCLLVFASPEALPDRNITKNREIRTKQSSEKRKGGFSSAVLSAPRYPQPHPQSQV